MNTCISVSEESLARETQTDINTVQRRINWSELIHVLSSEDKSAAAYMAGSLKTLVHAILSPCGLCLYLYMCRCGSTYRVTLKSVQLRNATTTIHVLIYVCLCVQGGRVKALTPPSSPKISRHRRNVSDTSFLLMGGRGSAFK